ncbi:MAG: choice-of-anchor tandem repeat GloVer-containing protein, partial [Candidatus Cybelea sp.]
MKISTLHCHALSVCVVAAMLAGCGGSQTPVGAPGAIPESHTAARAHVIVHRARAVSSPYQVLYSFAGPDGAGPYASLIDVKGKLYGTTFLGGKFNERGGTVFSVSTTGTEHILHSCGRPPNGRHPFAGLIDVSGTLYGTTSYGGAYRDGTVFSISTTGKVHVLHAFSGGDGASPDANLIDVKGTLYGTTELGGTFHNAGTVFSFTSAGSYRVLHSFGGNYDGANPFASLIDVEGTLYGTTRSGGTYGAGTVFGISKAGREHVLHSFGGGSSDGSGPFAGLINVKGTLYGTTQS